MRRRLNHLAAFESLASTDQPEFSDWADTRLDRWLVDWSLRNGKDATAKSIAKHQGIEVSQAAGPHMRAGGTDSHRIDSALLRIWWR